jgi:hypothetical protein
MVSHEAGPFAAAVVDGVSVVGSLAVAERVAVLPEHIASHARAGEGGSLPWGFDGDMVACRAVFF